jgi:hypothetical protein
VGEFECVAEECAYFFGVIGVDQSVGAGDHGLPPLRACYSCDRETRVSRG